MSVLVRVIDFETTGTPPEADVIEAGAVDVAVRGDGTAVTQDEYESLVLTDRPIEPEARAAHHLSDEEVRANGRPWPVVRAELLRGPVAYLAAHNADFERGFLPDVDVPFIDTYKCAIRAWPELPSHSNQALRYRLRDCDPGAPGMPPHRALPDCRVTALVLRRLLLEAPLSTLYEWSRLPRYLPKVPFGKHRGSAWPDVPRDYLTWVLRQDFEPDVMHAVREELHRRNGGTR